MKEKIFIVYVSDNAKGNMKDYYNHYKAFYETYENINQIYNLSNKANKLFKKLKVKVDNKFVDVSSNNEILDDFLLLIKVYDPSLISFLCIVSSEDELGDKLISHMRDNNIKVLPLVAD